MNPFRKLEQEQLKLKREKKEIIDGLLDVYNDYKWLYEWFGDEEYKQMMELAVHYLKKLTKRRE
jgi:hypothetical protein